VTDRAEQARTILRCTMMETIRSWLPCPENSSLIVVATAADTSSSVLDTAATEDSARRDRGARQCTSALTSGVIARKEEAL
jgi:hypothetical protein